MIKKTKEVEMVKLVIDIPKEMYERIKDGYVPLGISKYLKNGTPLPKGHGRIVDINELMNVIELEDNNENRENNLAELITLEDIDRITTIIKADGEEDEVSD